jgi:putative spermidine/putrescine transport system permease protein
MSNELAATLVSRRSRAWLYVLVGLALLFLVMPVLIIIPMSFSDSRFLDFPPRGWSLRWYRVYLTTPEWRDATWTSLRLAFTTCIVATPLGVAAAYAINASAWRPLQRIRTILFLPLMVPNVIIAIGLFFVLAKLNLVTTMSGLVAANVVLAIPLVLVATLSGLRHFDMNQELVARSLGYSPFWAFVYVTLPQIRGSVIAGALFAFVSALDEVIVALFISGGDNTTLTKIMFTALRDEIDPTIAAISTILIVVSLAIGVIAALVSRRES